MTKENLAAIYAAVGITVVMTIAFSLPPIVSRGGQSEPNQKEQTVTNEEFAYCRSNLSDVNCSCFARKAGHIQIQEQPKIHGFVYADRTEIARNQASQTC